jgi:hypothetical protein
MNYQRVSIVAAILIIGIGAGLYFFLKGTTPNTPVAQAPSTGTSFGTPAHPVTVAPDTAESFSIKFYQWYLTGTETVPGFIFSNDYKEHIGDWLTADFANRLPDIGTKLDQDPLFFSQDFQPDWLTTIHATPVATNGATSTVQVLLGTGPTARSLVVSVVQIPGGWRIADVLLGS